MEYLCEHERKYKRMNIVFCDIDGTFQEMGRDVAPINFEAIYALQKQGDRFVFISGRGYNQLTELTSQLENECDVIFSNGGGFKRIGEPIRYNHALSMDACETILTLLEDRKLFYHLHTSQGVILKPISYYQSNIKALRKKLAYLGEDGKKIMDVKETFFTEECMHVGNPLLYLKDHPEIKVMKIEIMEADDLEHRQLREELTSDSTYVFSSFVQCLEVTNPLSSKGNAINEYMEDFPEAVSYGIGDGENDLAMLEVVDVPVAVANAKDSVKENCQLIIGECIDAGVGTFLFEQLIK